MYNIMPSAISTARKWGHSIGVTLPSDIVRKLRISEGDEVELFVLKKTNPLKKWAGKIKLNKPVKAIMREIDKELYND